MQRINRRIAGILRGRTGWLWSGGLPSGFFGGLSGNQGALRSAFLIKTGLDKDAFVATNVVSAVIVDTVRLATYGLAFYTAELFATEPHLLRLVAIATVAALIGSYAGSRLLRKVTLRFVQVTVAVTMIIVGAALTVGLV